MSKRFIVVLAALVWLAGVAPARAATITLFEWAVNQNGAVTSGSAPANWNIAGFDTSTGLGTLTATFTSPGAHNVLLFLDIEIDENSNTFFNEVGGTAGSPAAGQSWEIDEPGFVFGNIFTNFTLGALDGTNGVPPNSPDDVSVALGWDFDVGADEVGIVTFIVTDIMPEHGFFLQQTDPDSQASVYFTSNLTIRGTQIPEPATLMLFGTGLMLLGARVRSRR